MWPLKLVIIKVSNVVVFNELFVEEVLNTQVELVNPEGQFAD